MTWLVIWKWVKAALPTLALLVAVTAPVAFVVHKIEQGGRLKVEAERDREKRRADQAVAAAEKAVTNSETLTVALVDLKTAMEDLTREQERLASEVTATQAAVARSEAEWLADRLDRRRAIEERDAARAEGMTPCEAAMTALEELAAGIE